MNDVQTLKSYLVGLGFSVDANQYKKFQNTLQDAAKTVNKETGDIAGSLIKWQVGIIGMFATVSTAVLGTMDKVATADQSYRLFGERMFMSTNNARTLKIALDALGEPMEAIAFDPELHDRFMQLQKDQLRMGAGVGGDYESNMKGIRDITFQITRLKVELQYLTMGTVSSIFKGLFGDGDVLKKMKEWNKWLINNIPDLSKKFSSYLVPVLKDTWEIMKDVAKLLGVLGMEFSNLVGIFSNDSSLEGTSFSFDKMARAIGTVVHWIATLMDWLVKLERHLPILEILGGAAAGGALGSVVPGVGTGIGAVAGGTFAGLYAMMNRIGSGDTGQVLNQIGASSIADKARALAARIGKETGADPSLIYAQFAHETGNFSHIAGTNNIAGMMIGKKYRNYASLDDFGNDYEKTLSSKRYSGIFADKTTDQWAHTLKQGGYYTDAESNYARGMHNFQPSYNQSSNGNLTVQVNVAGSNASADEIATAAVNKIKQHQSQEMQTNYTQLNTVFQ